MTIAHLGDFGTAALLAEMSLLIQRGFRSEYDEAIALFTAYNYVLPWTKPLQSCLSPFSQAYTCGMKSGNSECAMWSIISQHVFLPYQMGKPIGGVLEKCPSCTFQTEEVQQLDQCTILLIFWQLILNLRGESEETKILEGAVFSKDNMTTSTSTIDVTIHLAELELLIFFGDYRKAAKLAIQVGNSFAEALPGCFLIMLETFHRGVALYAMARRTKKRKFKEPAKKIRMTITKWVEKGNPNVKHYRLFLDAEHAALKKEHDKAEKLYRKAIVYAAKTGHLHDAALFNERYADFLVEEGVSNTDEAEYRIREAIRFYRYWGADRKAKLLEAGLENNGLSSLRFHEIDT